MRIVKQIPNPTFRITLYEMEKWYYVELEAGPMKQAYRFNKEAFPNVPAVEAVFTETWLEKIRVNFNNMFLDYKEATSK